MRSGFSVSVIDAFADEEVSALADNVIPVSLGELGFDANHLLVAVSQLINQQNFHACLYGSGFEAQPALLEKLTNMLTVHGNTPQVLRQIKNVETFFTTLSQFNIPYPKVFSNFPENSDRPLLVKSITGCGGQHIRYVDATTSLAHDEYFQEHVDGESVSVLFLAENTDAGNFAHIVGFNAQWVTPSLTQPFRFGGIASQAALTEPCKKRLCEMIRQLSNHLRLIGLNSLDVVIKNEEIFVLEINPRLSASFDLYAQDWLELFDIDLLSLHIACSLGKPLNIQITKKLETLVQQHPSAKAMQVVYAERDVTLSGSIDWPDWVKDRPIRQEERQQKSINILKGSPICTVISQGNTALSAISAVKSRVNLIHHMM